MQMDTDKNLDDDEASHHVRFLDRESESSNTSVKRRRQHHKSFIMSKNIMEVKICIICTPRGFHLSWKL